MNRATLLVIGLIAGFTLQANGVAADLATLERLARDGDAAAQATLADVYHNGVGVLQDFSTAVKWRRLAALQGHAAAQNALGRHYAEGLGVEQDAQKALHYLHAAAEQGDPQHQHDLGLLFDEGDAQSRDPKQAAQWYERAAKQGFAMAEANLGLLYYLGRGVEKDFDRAFTLLSSAAENGHARAQNNLGLMYTRGDGVERDYALAVQWYERAADQGLAQALTNLGVMYDNGFGVAFDEAEAKRLYRLAGAQGGHSLGATLESIGFPYDARLVSIESSDELLSTLSREADAGDPLAQYALAYLLTNSNAVQHDYSHAARLYATAAAKGLHSAMLNLGLLHMRGLGVPQDYVSGYMWISRSAVNGSATSIAIRDRLLPYLTAKQLNDAQKLALDATP